MVKERASRDRYRTEKVQRVKKDSKYHSTEGVVRCGGGIGRSTERRNAQGERKGCKGAKMGGRDRYATRLCKVERETVRTTALKEFKGCGAGRIGTARQFLDGCLTASERKSNCVKGAEGFR